jgi:hypothetical protein
MLEDGDRISSESNLTHGEEGFVGEDAMHK